MSFNIQRRDGLYSLQKTAKRLCQLIVTFSPVIRRLYPSNTALQTALDAALAACEVLEQQVTAQRQQGV